LPPAGEVGVSCTTYASWKEVAQWLHSRSFERAEITDEIRQKVVELVAGRATDLEKAQALSAWVRDAIRYRADIFNEYQAQPHTPHETFTNRYGACWDRSLLLATMLREAGLPCAFVFVNVAGTAQIVPEVPHPLVNHAFLVVRVGEVSHWVDTTATLNQWDELRPDCYGRQVLLVGDGQFALTNTPYRPADAYRIASESIVTLGEDGVAHWRTSRIYERLAAAEARQRWMNAKAADIELNLLAECRVCYAAAELAELQLDRAALARPDEPLQLSFDLSVPQAFTGEGVKNGMIYEVLMQPYLAAMVPAEAPAPLFYDKPFELVHVVRLQLREGQALDRLPLGGHVASKWGSVDLGVESAGRELRLTWRFRVELPWVEPADMAEFGQFRMAAIQLLGSGVSLAPPAVATAGLEQQASAR
jgi:hypothetical protein